MGRLIYVENRFSFEIDDHLLAHLRIVVTNKLRRGESFVMTTPSDASGHRALWIGPAIPLTFHLFGLRAPKIDPRLIDELMRVASGPDGLDLRDFAHDATPAAEAVDASA